MVRGRLSENRQDDSARRLYHIGHKAVTKPITSVENTADAMLKLAEVPDAQVVGRTFYLADWPQRSLREWAECIREACGAPRIRTVPLSVMRIAGNLGDCLKKMGIADPPVTSYRLANMTEDVLYPIDATAKVVGPLPFDLEEGVGRTVRWIMSGMAT